MSRATTTFGLLQASASVVAIAVLLWSLGIPSLRIAQAENVVRFSNTLSDSAPIVPSDHTIYFETPSGVAEGETIELDFSDGPFTGTSTIASTSIAVFRGTTELDVADDCSGAEEIGAAFVGNVLVLTICNGNGGAISAMGSTTILIGTNAGGTDQLVNPAIGSNGSKVIGLVAGEDVGETRVFIISPVEVTAAVDTIFTFVVEGLDPSDGSINQSPITATSSPIELPFGKLDETASSTVGHSLAVSTNAAYGFAVTTVVDQQLNSGSATIGGFYDNTFQASPMLWQGPGGSVTNPDSFGHWGITTDDETVAGGDPFDVAGDGRRYVSASTTPVTVFAHTGPADGQEPNIGRVRVGYTAEISALQPAGDYIATLTYVATPVF
jgi:uncharacterized protein YaaQ